MRALHVVPNVVIIPLKLEGICDNRIPWPVHLTLLPIILHLPSAISSPVLHPDSGVG